MKKAIGTLAVVLCTLAARADEGMWLLPYLQQMNWATMQERGVKLDPEKIYNDRGTSLKDAIVIFGNGCTGEIVSPDGLLFTNYHCGHGSIQQLSSVEHDYLQNGYWAASREEELPVPGLMVRFIRRIEEVTPQVLGNVPSTAGEREREQIARQNIDRLQSRLERRNPGSDVLVKSFYEGNRYFAFVIDTYEDIRLVGTPPFALGKFGGETDNWMWPRHTCDFSVFRVYADRKGRPAAYAADNVPYKAPVHLEVSLRGYREGDYAMIMGFPGTTHRYMTSWEIEQQIFETLPIRIVARGERQKIWAEAMQADDRVRIQYSSKFAISSNTWKNAIGMTEAIRKRNVIARKQAEEAAFTRWAAENTLPEEGFIDALGRIRESVQQLSPLTKYRMWMADGLNGIDILQIPRKTVRPADSAGRLSATEVAAARQRGQAAYKDYDEATDRKMAKRMLALLREHLTAEQWDGLFPEVAATYAGSTEAFVDALYDGSVFRNHATFERFMADDPTAEPLIADPVYRLASAIDTERAAVERSIKVAEERYGRGRRLYMAGRMRMEPERLWYPDANFTIRLTYGNVLPYDPEDGVTYRHYTTLRGVMEKEDTANPVEFTVPEALKERYAARDFGRYANEHGELPAAFLTNTDITGGNSGSPVLDAEGRLIGLAFDGNWEALSGNMAFEPEVQRCINLDVRYLLFVMDKVYGAGYLLDELTLVE